MRILIADDHTMVRESLVGVLQAEPGVDRDALERLAEAGEEVFLWDHLNLFFGGVQAVTRDPASGELAGGGDPRRGGAVAIA